MNRTSRFWMIYPRHSERNWDFSPTMGRGPWENAPSPMSMNEQVAYAVIDSELNRLRKSPYSDLTALVGKPETKQVIAEDGKSYQLEIQAVWASKKGGDLMVIVSADDGGWRAFKPLTCDFIMRPDGTFVGESFGGY